MLENRHIRILYVGFLAGLLWLSCLFYLRHERGVSEEVHLASQTGALGRLYQSVVNSEQIIMQASFNSHVMQPGVLEILRKAKGADAKAAAVQRALLYRRLFPAYERLRQRGVRQLHFHTADYRSFLRFHAPHLSGDSLAASRPSVVTANREQKIVQGFETGRLLAGYRSVFPIAYKGEALGSVEISQPFETLRRLMENAGKGDEWMVAYKASLLLPKLFEEHKKIYEPSLFSRDWLVEDAKRQLPDSPPAPSDRAREIYAGLAKLPAFVQALASNEPQSLAIAMQDGFYRVTLLPVLDPEGLPATLLLALAEAPELDEIYWRYHLYLLAVSGLVIFGAMGVLLFLRNREDIVAKKN